MARWLRWGSLAVGALAGVAAFLYPFFLPAAQAANPDMAHSGDAPLAFFALLGLTLVATLAAVEARGFDAKTVALLGVLVAMNAALRIVPAPAGALVPVWKVMPVFAVTVPSSRMASVVGVKVACRSLPRRTMAPSELSEPV